MKEVLKKIGMVLGFALIIAGLYFAYTLVSETVGGKGEVHIEFIKTEKDADATLICHEGMAILIDAGEEDDADSVISTLKQYNIEHLNYIILSHGDKDHIGSVKRVMEEVSIGKVIAPYYTGSDEMKELLKDMDEKGISILYPAHNMHISAGEIDINCYPCLEKHYSDENNYSLAVLIRHHNINMLFTGDALRVRSEELLRIHWRNIALYKVPHHGRANSKSMSLFEEVNPEIAVVTSSKCDEEIEEAANECGSMLLYTRPDGLSFVSDGKVLTYIQKVNAPEESEDSEGSL